MTSYLKRKDRILMNAIEILDRLGVQGMTTRKIAEEQGISEPAIYRQYRSKDEIILGIIDKLFQFDQRIINTVKEQKMNSIDALNYYSKTYAQYFENYPEIVTVIFTFDIYRYNEVTLSKFKEVWKIRQDFIIDLIEQDKKEGKIDKSINSDKIADIFNGSLFWLIYKFKLFENISLANEIDGIIDLIISYILQKQ